MERRTFLKAAPVGLAASALPITALAAQSKLEQIRHHAEELHRLLAKTMPVGGVALGRFMQIDPDGTVLATALDGYVFRSERGGWAHEREERVERSA